MIIESLFSPREDSALQEGLDEELSIEDRGSRVERRTGDGRVNFVGSGDRVTGMEGIVRNHDGLR